MEMDESPHAILEYGYYTGTSSTWQKLFDYKPDPQRKSHIDRITIKTSAGSVGAAQLKIVISNDKILDMKDSGDYMAITELILVYSGKLVLDGKKHRQGIQVYVKSEDVTTIVVHASMTGIEVDKSSEN